MQNTSINQGTPEEKLEILKVRMSTLQQQARALGLPVVLIFEGFDASGKGEMISTLIESLDPRGFKVRQANKADETERRFHWMRRFFEHTPQNGQFAIFDHGWYRDVSKAIEEDGLDKKTVDRRFEEIADLEGKLVTGGALVVKFFLYVTKKQQKKRFKKLESSAATSWRVTKSDWRQNKHYKRAYKMYDDMVMRSDFPYARWHMLDTSDKKLCARRMYMLLINALEQALGRKRQQAEHKVEPQYRFLPYVQPVPTAPIRPLSEYDLSVRLDESEMTYKQQLKAAQERLRELQFRLYLTKTPVVIGFEGWDAAGKGGAILRLTQGLDPRGFEVNPTASPDATQKAHHYLWRFWHNVPKSGHIGIFDRTWYGRVMVERIEGFCSDGDWRRAYDEINQFEKQLHDWGAVVLKFWMQIDQDEQLARFTARQNTPGKMYKITDEDWRNREKWPQYEVAVNEMLQKTNTKHAPWIVVESVDKYFARIKVINTVIKAIEDRLAP